MVQIISGKVVCFITWGLSSIVLVMGSQVNSAQAITFSGLSNNLAASADFQLNGDTLTLRLTNSSLNDVAAPADLLTGIFFNASKSLNLVSATLGYGSQVYQNGSVISTQPTDVSVSNLQGGWQYNSSISNSTLGGINQGIGTAGFGIFNGNLTGNGNQFDYGLLSASANLTANANSPVQSTTLIQNSILFTFAGASGLTESSISNVIFQYGTNLSEPHFAGLTLADATIAADTAAKAADTAAKFATDKATEEKAAQDAVAIATTKTVAANETAKSAKLAAEKAATEQTKAEEATKSAKLAADSAQTTANNKKAEADSAQTAANNKKAEADSAQTAANNKKAEADKAKGNDKGGKQKDADDAQALANTKKAEADNTQALANTKKAEADNAQALANTKKAEADNIQALANIKKAEADNKKIEADKAAQDLADKLIAQKALEDKAAQATKEKEAAVAAAKVAKEIADKETAQKAAVEQAEKTAKETTEKEAAAKAQNQTQDKAADKTATSTRPLPILNFSLSDVGKQFQLNFDGSVATQNVAGLTSTAWLTLTSFTGGIATFDVALDNTSSQGINSRTSGFGFNVYSDMTSTNKLDLVGDNTNTSGLFNNAVLDGSFPNQFGNVDVCFTEGNTCQGGQNGGVYADDGIKNFTFSLAFKDTVESFALGNFGVRYQSIEGTNLGTSGTGRGTYYQAPPPEPKKVPEPSTVSALGLMIVGALKLLKKKP